MSFHPHSFLASASPASTSFTPLFRLLDDFDTYTRASPARTATTFNPKFDARELPTHFELHGELAGVNQRDITIEFTDPQTLSIRGRSERSYTSGTPPATIEAGKPTAAIEEGATTQKADHQPSVEDEDAASTTVTAQSVQAQKPKEQKPKESEERLWVSERSVGSFARSFTFPGRIDQDAVTASMKDGILTVVVPKAKKHESRKIQIS